MGPRRSTTNRLLMSARGTHFSYTPGQKKLCMQDGAPVHRAAATQRWLRQRRVTMFKAGRWQAQFPDFNVIGHVWAKVTCPLQGHVTLVTHSPPGMYKINVEGQGCVPLQGNQRWKDRRNVSGHRGQNGGHAKGRSWHRLMNAECLRSSKAALWHPV